MNDVIRFLVIGAAAGSIYALLGLGVNAVYRSSRVVNFSHAAIAISSAYIYGEAAKVLPVPAALAVGLLSGVLIGVLTELLVMRPLKNVSSLTKAIATIGVLIILQAVLNLRYGYLPVVVPAWLPTDLLTVAGTPIGLDRVIILALCVALTAGLYALYRRSSFGIATTALADSPRSLAALGRWSPGSVSLINWAIGGGLAGLAGLLLAPITSLSPPLCFTLIVPILSAALLGNFSSFWLTLAAGIGIGVLQAELGQFVPIPGVQESVPFLVIVVVLALRGSSLPRRGEAAERLPRIGSGRVPWVAVIVCAVITFVLTQWVLEEEWVIALTAGMIVAVVLFSLVVVTGYAGQLSLASYALAGVAALVTAQLFANGGWPFLPAAIVGVLATIPVGLLVGLPAVRTRGTSLAIVTLGLAVAFQALVLNNPVLSSGTAGFDLSDVEIFGLPVSAVFYPRRYAVIVLLALVISGVMILNLRRSAPGRRMVAVRSNERAAASIGVSVARTKLYAFVVSGIVAGVGGVLLAFTNLYLVMGDPGGRFGASYSITSIAEITVGGVGFISGAMLGTLTEPTGVIGQLLQAVASGSWFNLIGGVLLIVTVITAPSGVAANFQLMFAGLANRLRRPRAGDATAPASTSDGDEESLQVEPVESAVLRVDGLSVRFGATLALDAVSLQIQGGQVVGVIGPNGAGKTTLIDAITGYSRPFAGTIAMDGVQIGRLAPAARARLGLARSFQSLELFEDLSVRDNLIVAAESPHWWSTLIAGLRPGRPRLSPAAAAAVGSFGLSHRLDDMPGDLSYGERRLLAIARALAGRPRVLLLDEPAAGLGSEERKELRDLVRTLAERWGIAVLIIEHDVELVLGVSDRVVAMDFGRVIASGTPDEIRRDPAVIKAYLGTEQPGQATKAGVGE
jgi:sulfate-transporting ATPase